MKFARYVGRRCTDPEYASLLESAAAVIDTTRGTGNVAVSFVRRGARQGRMQMRWQAITRDFFDLSAMLYVADELAKRDEAWTRRLQFTMPVVDPAIWSSNEDLLADVLGFLTGDTYEFRWIPTRRPEGYGRHRVQLPRGHHTVVCMFSGGLDSLIGAVRLLDAGESVLLVGHHADGVTSTAQRELFDMVHRQFGNRVELIQCGLRQSTRRNPTFELPEIQFKEDSHRARSFLFLALGFAVASGAAVDRVVLAENGLIALNPPLGASRVGSLSTRTAHPRFLGNLLSCVHSLGAFNGHLENPFLYESKTDMMSGIQDWLEPLVLRSVSCAHAATSVRWAGQSNVRHCGYCVPCIYRRVALMSVDLDDPADYCEDIFRELHNLTETKQVDMRFLVRFAMRVASAGAAQLRSLVVSHGTFPADIGRRIGPYEVADYGPWADMLSRWADDFLSRLDQCASVGTNRLLGVATRRRPQGASGGSRRTR